jgi:hypothetical protein
MAQFIIVAPHGDKPCKYLRSLYLYYYRNQAIQRDGRKENVKMKNCYFIEDGLMYITLSMLKSLSVTLLGSHVSSSATNCLTTHTIRISRVFLVAPVNKLFCNYYCMRKHRFLHRKMLE